MNAEALIGTVLGTCMLQKLIGQGGMGAVFLAQQSRPRRQVAVKVLLPVSSQSPNQQAAFLERFRRETDAAASLEHPNIVPVHEYGERGGLAYLVMPYISGGTLRDEMENEEPFPLAKAMSYLDQMAAALDCAHEHGVIHRDIKPANILMTPERRLLLTDFGLVKVITDSQGQSPNSRLTAVGVPMGTPDYMAPEQVIGVEVDSRADLYSLGVILFQMTTGKTPFQGDMPMQIAMQHLHTPAPSPRIYRPDLSIGTEQVILRALAKRPTDRYANASEFANAFRLALTVAGVPLGDTQMGMAIPAMAQEARSFTRRSLFDPMWQTNGTGQADASIPRSGLLRPMPPMQANPAPTPPLAEQGHRNDIVAKTSMTMPSFSGFFEPPTRSAPQVNAPLADVQSAHMTPLPESVFPQNALPVSQEPASTKNLQNNPASLHGLRFGRRSLLRATDVADPSPASANLQNSVATPAEPGIPPAMLAAMGIEAGSSATQAQQPHIEAPQPSHPTTLAGLSGSYSDAPWQAALSTPSSGLSNPLSAENQAAQPLAQNSPEQPGSASITRSLGNTNALVPSQYDGQGMTGMIKLSQAMKVVKVPIAGKPGTYMTGLLPMSPEIQEAVASQQTPDSLTFLRKNLKKVALLALVLLVVISAGTIAAITHKSPASPHLSGPSSVNLSVVATANAIATAQSANIILEDSLSSNIHSWKESSTGNLSYVFKDGKYHVSVNNGDGAALADLPEEIMPDSFVFSVDASEIKGDDTSVNNQFGLVFRLNQSQKGGQPWVTFYCFQVQNTQNDVEYQLRKYDSSYADDAEKWSTPWHVNAGKEFHFAHGTTGTNSFRLIVKGGNFTFIVNEKTVGTFQDMSFKAGRVGFLVNQKGTEVAFSNLLLTNK